MRGSLRFCLLVVALNHVRGWAKSFFLFFAALSGRQIPAAVVTPTNLPATLPTHFRARAALNRCNRLQEAFGARGMARSTGGGTRTRQPDRWWPPTRYSLGGGSMPLKGRVHRRFSFSRRACLGAGEINNAGFLCTKRWAKSMGCVVSCVARSPHYFYPIFLPLCIIFG